MNEYGSCGWCHCRLRKLWLVLLEVLQLTLLEWLESALTEGAPGLMLSADDGADVEGQAGRW